MVREGELEKAVLVCGAGHSGSTLLGLILDSHSDCCYVGEGGKIRYLGDDAKALRKRVCKICGESCPVWSTFEWDPERPLYPQVARHVGRSVVVDSTKSPVWIEQRVQELASTHARAHLVFLVRDGRAVVNSRIRKYPERAPQAQIDQWVGQIRRSQVLFDRFAGPKLRIRYEELATRPEPVIRTLTDFLGLRFEPAMLRFQEFEHHPLGGNNGTQFLAARSRLAPGSAFVTLGERSRTYYQHHADGIHLDLRWKTELRDEHLRLFESLAGDFNRPLEWEVQSVQS